MTLLVRWITSFEQKWLDQLADSDEGAIANVDACPWALSLFLPSEKDNGALSVYEVVDEDEARVVAAALMMKAKDDQRYAFSVVETAAVRAAGIKIVNSLGITNHPNVDAMHRDLRIPTVSVAMSVASLYLTGDLYSFEKKELWPALSNEAANDRFNHQKLAGSGGPFYTARLARLIHAKTVSARGISALKEVGLN